MKCTRVSPLQTEGEGSTQYESSKGVKIVHLEACIWKRASGCGILILTGYLPVTATISKDRKACEFGRL